MVLGLSLATFTSIHVAISLLALLAGAVAAADLLLGRISSRLQLLFLVTTTATSITGFFFHTTFGPAHVIGIISLAILAVSIYAFRLRHVSSRWQHTYLVTAFAAFYFNMFVAVVQAFQKMPPLHALAPTQKEPPFAIAQGLLLLAMIVTTTIAYRRLRTTSLSASTLWSSLST